MSKFGIVFLMVACLGSLRGDDWPQWRGLGRDGVSTELGMLDAWPKNGPPHLWTIDSIGEGYSGPAVVGTRFFIMVCDGKTEFLTARSVESGLELWRLEVGPKFKNPWGDGPRGTPSVSNGFVVALGAQGVLVCAEVDSGKEAWRTDLRKDHAGKLMRGNVLNMDWGYSESPLVDQGRVVVSPGGANGTIIALDLKTGASVWKTTALTDYASYTSAIATTIRGVRQYVQFTGGVEISTGLLMKSPPQVVGIDPATGTVLWRHKINYTTAGIINTPTAIGDVVYASCGYGAGCTMLRIDKTADGWKPVDITTADARKTMVCYHGGIVPAGDRVFGYSDVGGWVCQSIPSGDVRWSQQRGIGAGSVIRVGARLLILTTDGLAALTEPNEDGWKVRGEFRLPQISKIRKANGNIKVCTHPVVADGRLYIRDQELLHCYDLRGGR